MKRLFAGRVRKVGMSGAAMPKLIAPRPIDLGGVADAVIGELDADHIGFAALATMVREIVASERASGAVPANTLASRLAQSARPGPQGRAAVADFSDRLAGLAVAIGNAIRMPRSTRAEVMRVRVALIGVVEDAPRMIEQIVGEILSWSSEGTDVRLGGALAHRVKHNLLLVSGLREEQARQSPNRLVWPSALKGVGPEQLVERYLGGTAVGRALLTPVEWIVDDGDLVESLWCVAKSGHGKSQGLEWLFLRLLGRPDPPSMVVIDGQGQLIRRLSRLKVFAPGQRLHDRLILVSARDLDRPVAMNPFALRKDRLASYPPDMAEQVMNGITELMTYFFSGLLGAELTHKQGMTFGFLVRLMMALPAGTTIGTLRDVLRNPERYREAMERLDGSARDFFLEEFFERDYTATRRQVVRRLWGLFENPVFERLLCAEDNRVDWFERLQAGAIVLCDVDKGFLGKDRSAVLARLIVALVGRGIFERAVIPEGERRPTFLWIDEAHEMVDEKIVELLSQARKFACGSGIFHQFADQLPRDVRKSLQTNTSVRLIGAISKEDAQDLASDLGTSAGFLQGVRRRQGHSEFSLFVSHKTHSAVRFCVPLGALTSEPMMTDAEWKVVEERNRERYGAKPRAVAPATRVAPVVQVEDEDWRS